MIVFANIIMFIRVGLRSTYQGKPKTCPKKLSPDQLGGREQACSIFPKPQRFCEIDNFSPAKT